MIVLQFFPFIIGERFVCCFVPLIALCIFAIVVRSPNRPTWTNRRRPQPPSRTCSRCSMVNRPEARYCANCGLRLL